MNYGALPQDWYNLDLLGLTADLLPVVSNPDSPISPKSSLKSKGKVPSVYNRNRQIAGIPNWTNHQTTAAELERWSKEPDYGLCIQTRNVRALDIDVEDRELAQSIVEFISGHFHWLGFPCRSRANSGKCLLAFVIPGEMAKRVMKVKGGVIEFLANGQHFVAHGSHPSGARYEWDWCDHHNFPKIDPDQFEDLWQKLTENFAIEPPSSSTLRNPLSDPNQGILAAMHDPVVAAMEEAGIVTGLGKEGQIFIKCPWEHEHTEKIEGGSSTAYLPAGTRDYDCGHFLCMHAHCQSRDDGEFLDSFGYRIKDFETILPDLECSAQVNVTKFNIITAHKFSQRPPVDWIIKGVIPKANLMLIYGSSGDGKTFVALDMALSIARGVEWNGCRVKQGNCIYICAEGAGGFVSRLKAYAIEHALSLENIPLGIIPDAPDFRKAANIQAIANKCLAYGKTDLIIVDTLAQVTPGSDENTGKDMGPVLRHCEELHRLTGAMICLIHHAGKDLSRGARGWSGLKAPLDAEIQVSRDGETRKVWVEKMKDSRDGYGWSFVLKSVNVGEDLDGDTMTSCTVAYTGSASILKAKPMLKGKNQNLVFDAFIALGGGEVSFAALVDEAKKHMPQIAIGPRDRRAQRIAEAIEALQEKGELKYERGMVSAPL